MRPTSWWRRLAELDPVDRQLILEAALLLTLVRVGLRIWSLPTLQRLLARRPQSPEAGVPVNRIAWAVRTASAHLGETTCLMDALAAWAMLERRGYAAALRLGVRRSADTTAGLDSHAWVECDGQVVLGDTGRLAEYTVLPSLDSTR